MKKVFSVLLSLMLLLSGMTFDVLASNDGIEILQPVITYKSGNSVYAGEVITLKIRLKAASGVTNVNVKLDNSKDYLPENDTTEKAATKIDAENWEAIFKLKYQGGGTTNLPIIINYENDGNKLLNGYVGINAVANNIDDSGNNGGSISNQMPIFTIADTNISSAYAGELVRIPVTIKNIGSFMAKKLVITPDLADKESPFTIEDAIINKTIENIYPNTSSKIEFTFKVKDSATAGMYPLKLNLKYSNSSGETKTEDIALNVKIVNSNTLPRLELEKITTTPNNIKAGERVKVDFIVKNKGTIEAKDVKVVVDGIGKNFVIVNNSNTQYLGAIPGGEAKAVKFELQATDNIEKGGQVVDLKLSGKDIGEETYKFFVNVGGGNGAGSSPKLIIDRYSFQPSLVRAGQNFDMNLSFFNTNSEKAVKNIKIILTVDEKTEASGSVFSPVNTSNTFYIDEIPAKGRVEKNITMFTVPDAKAKTYTLTANFEYEDEDGKELKATELIGVPVVQQTKLEIGNIEVQPEGFLGQPIPVHVQFYNKGKVTLSNVMIELKGDFGTENGQYFLGNFESGNSESYDGSIIPNKPGQLKGTLVFSYDDTAGEHVEIKKEFDVNVMEMPPMEPGIDKMPQEMKPQSNKKKLMISTGLFLVTVTGFVIWKRNKKKKGMTLDE